MYMYMYMYMCCNESSPWLLAEDIGGEEIDGGLLEANSTVRLLYDYVSAALLVSAKDEILIDVIRESKTEKLLSSSPKLGF